MKRVLNFGSLLMILALLVSACGKDPKIEPEFTSEDMGRFSVTLGAFGSFEVVSKAAAAVDPRTFTVNISGTTLKNTPYDTTWQKYSDMGKVVEIPAGNYIIKAYNGEQKSGFETPYYYGEKAFSVGVQEYTQAEVLCQLACVKVTVDFTALFMSNVTKPSCMIHQCDGVSLEFNETNKTQVGYIAVPSDGRLAVSIRGNYTEDGSPVDKTYYINAVEAKQWHKIKLSVNTSAGLNNPGGMIQIDHTTIDKNQDVFVPGSGDIIGNNGDTGSWEDTGSGNQGGGEGQQGGGQGGGTQPEVNLPKIVGVGFDIDQMKSLTQAETASCEIDIQFDVADKIDSLIVSMDSPALTEAALQSIGLSKTFDIANLDSAKRVALEEIGLIAVGDIIRGKTNHLFKIGSFMGMLAGLPGGVGNVHKFNLRVVDQLGKKTEKTLSVNITQ